jgi:hypothetical protein
MASGSAVAEERLQAFLASRSGPASSYWFLPAVSRYGSFVLAFAQGSTVPVDWLEIVVKQPYPRRSGD